MFSNIPTELKRLNQWVLWGNGKIPYGVNGNRAKSNKPETWSGFDRVLEAFNNSYGRYDGIGFMFANGYFGVDLDRIGDAETGIASEFVTALKSYTEYSPSKNGIHIICRGVLPPKGRRSGNVEMYSEGRFFTVTGDIYSQEYREIVDGTEVIATLHEKYIGSQNAKNGIVKNDLLPDDILAEVEKSKHRDAFFRLYRGDYTGIPLKSSGEPDYSKADQKFCNMLAFWCKGCYNTMDAIFRASGLMRDKWDEMRGAQTYGELTINSAIAFVKNHYKGKREESGAPEGYSITIGGTPDLPPKKGPVKIRGLDDTGMAERLVDTYGDVIFCNGDFKDGTWLVFDGKLWIKGCHRQVEAYYDKILENLYKEQDAYVQSVSADMETDDAVKIFEKFVKKYRSNASCTSVINRARHLKMCVSDEFDTGEYRMKFNTPDNTIDLAVSGITPHNAKNMITRITSAAPSNAPCPIWLNFLQETFMGDSELIEYVQRVVGYAITGSTKEQKYFICYGSGGNGKGVFFQTLTNILGNYAANMRADVILVKQVKKDPGAELARLKAVRLAVVDEIGEHDILDERMMNQLSGGGSISVQALYQNPIEFTPYVKLFILTNYKPKVDGLNEATWRRLQLIPFLNNVTKDKIDKDLSAKLEVEYPAILAWCIRGARKWIKYGLPECSAVENATKEYRSEMNCITDFLYECTKESGGSVSAKELYECYKVWADDNGYPAVSQTKFGAFISKKHDKKKSCGVYRYFGITLKDEYKPHSVSIGAV